MDQKQINVEYGITPIEPETASLTITLTKKLSTNFVVNYSIESSSHVKTTLSVGSDSFAVNGVDADLPVGNLHYNVIYL